MSASDKLMLAEVEALVASVPSDARYETTYPPELEWTARLNANAPALARQLLEAMRENERLRQVLVRLEEQIRKERPKDYEQLARWRICKDALQPHKHPVEEGAEHEEPVL